MVSLLNPRSKATERAQSKLTERAQPTTGILPYGLTILDAEKGKTIPFDS